MKERADRSGEADDEVTRHHAGRRRRAATEQQTMPERDERGGSG
jgi:hypothetical protein